MGLLWMGEKGLWWPVPPGEVGPPWEVVCLRSLPGAESEGQSVRPEEETLVALTQSLVREVLGDAEGKRGWVSEAGRWDMGDGRAGRTG